jgi:hypothetical protein
MSEEEKNHLSNSGLGDTWRAMKISSENDPELKDQLDDIELADLKRKDFRFNPDVGKWCNAYGDRLTAGDAYRERQIVRLKAKKFIKNPKQLDKFMSAKSYDEYKAGPYEKILHKLKNPNPAKKKIYNYQPTLPGIEPEVEVKKEFKPIKTAQDIQFENFVEQQKQQKAKREYELNNTGIALLKDRLIT